MRIEPSTMERAEAEAIYEQGREAVVAALLALSAQVAALEARLAKQEERIAELERRLNRNSRNSSLPPSADPPGAASRKRPSPADRKRGGQHGHKGHGRHLQPIEAVDEIVDHWPWRCACGHRFTEAERRPTAAPARHQVAELPSLAVTLTEHRLQRLRCPDCGAQVRAKLPAEVPPGAFGARLQAAVATLVVRNRVSRRDTIELLRELFGARLSTGSIDAIVQQTGTALAQPYEELAERIRAAPAVNIDETGWRTCGCKRTLWGALTRRAAVFRIAPDRHEREAKALLGEHFAGIACSDRWWAYNYLEPERRQLCWAHLVRDFTAHSEGLGAQKQFGLAGLKIAGELFAAWDDYRADGDRARLAEHIAPPQKELRALLKEAAHKSPPQPIPPHLRQAPAQRLAGAVDLRQRARRRAHQQPCRAWPARRGHLPQALLWQSVRGGRAEHRAPALGLGHLPAAEALAVRLPFRGSGGQHPRRSGPLAA